MHISCSGHIPAGEYNDKISVSGSGKLDGNVRCTSLSCSGSVHGTGYVQCSEDVRVSGSCHIDGQYTVCRDLGECTAAFEDLLQRFDGRLRFYSHKACKT